jgi:DNA repair protein RecN (Recombination protein N)
MLVSLDIRDILIIDQLHLEFGAGLNILTGETGAGKSILLDALGLALGWRGRADLVRSGASSGEVIAVFDLPLDHPIADLLNEAGFEYSGELIIRRVNSVDGRKTAWINDRRISGELLRSIGEQILELHGQNDDRGLLDAKGHRAILDAYAQHDTLVHDVSSAWRAWSAARKSLAQIQDQIAQASSEEEFLRHAVQELDQLEPQEGEEEALDKERRLMRGASQIRDDMDKAASLLSYDGAEGAMNDALRWLEGAADQAEGGLDPAIGALGRAMNELAEAEDTLRGFIDQLNFDPHQLEILEERLFALRGLARKHNVSVDGLVPLREKMSAQLATIDNQDAALAEAQQTCARAQDAYDAAAAQLRESRAQAAQQLQTAMSEELAPLKMERAVFTVSLEAADPGPTGADAVQFRVATNPGAPAGALNKVASGGELSRFLLALKVCLRNSSERATMIFDEIDRGVGGATADAVGRRLAHLAAQTQVLVVTHSPQVAALGHHHWRVQKTLVDDMTLSQVVPLSMDERVEEIARMLSGDRVTDAAREAAQSLLQPD